MRLEDYPIIVENFPTLENMVDTMENRKVNSVFEYEDLSSQNKDGVRFSGVKTYQDARELLKDGYKDPLNQMKQAILNIGEMDTYQRPRIQTDFIGFVPNVPNTIRNLPMTMFNREIQPKQDKTICLTYGFCASGNVKADEIIKGGINFISLVNSLEKQGYRVRIDFHFASHSDNSIIAFNTTLKQYDQDLNLLKLTFPLVHPSMLRRITFKWIETLPKLEDKAFKHGYGRPLAHKFNSDGKAEGQFLTDKGILKEKNHYYVNIYQAMKSTSVEDLASRIGLK